MTKTELLDRCARDREERVLLGRVLDKGELTRTRGVPAHTAFLTPGQRAAAEGLLNAWGRPKCLFWGGYEGAERTVCAFLPDWQEPGTLPPTRMAPWGRWRPSFPGRCSCPTGTSWAGSWPWVWTGRSWGTS